MRLWCAVKAVVTVVGAGPTYHVVLVNAILAVSRTSSRATPVSRVAALTHVARWIFAAVALSSSCLFEYVDILVDVV